MKNEKELEIKVRKIISDTRIPQEMKDRINGYYKEYYDAYDSYIKKVRIIEGLTISYALKEDTERDFEGDKEAIEATLDGAYAIKKDTVLHELLNELKYISGKNKRELDAFLFDTHQEEKEYNENKDKYKIDKIINNRSNNEIFIETVKNEIIGELLSSKRYILQKTQLQNLGRNDMEKSLQIRDAKNRLEEDVDIIVQKIERDFPEVGKVLTEQDREIYEVILEVIEEYKIETEHKETNYFSEQRRKFVEKNRQGVNVDEELAKGTLQEKEVDYSKNVLDGNIIS